MNIRVKHCVGALGVLPLVAQAQIVGAAPDVERASTPQELRQAHTPIPLEIKQEHKSKSVGSDHRLAAAGTASTDSELLPQIVGGIMESHNDEVCPSRQSVVRAKEILVHLTGAVGFYEDSSRDILVKSHAAPPETAAAMVSMVNENNHHLTVMRDCRDAIAKQLGMSNTDVQRLYEYNTLSPNELAMFEDLSANYRGQPNYFSKLLAMSDQRKSLHAVDLELVDLDFEVAQFRTMVVKDVGTRREETDRTILSRLTAFRGALQTVRTKIASRAAGSNAN